MPRKPKNKSGHQEENMNSRTSEESTRNTDRSASMGDDVEETTYTKESTVEEDVEDIDVTDDEDEDESAPRRS